MLLTLLLTQGTAGPVSHDTSGALTGPGSSVVGAASSATERPSSGVLVGQGSTVAGSATRFRAHATSGALTGPGATLAGSASRFRAMSATGVLVGPGSAINGSAARAGGAVTHDTSGALAGQSAAVAGSAARLRAFATSGHLAGQGSAVSGTANRLRAFETSGALSGQGAAVEGAAARSGAVVVHDATGALQGQGSTVTGEASGPVQQRNAGFEMVGRKVYIKRGKRIHIFNTIEDADEWADAEQAALDVIAKAQKPARNAKKRAVRKVNASIEHETINLVELDRLVQHFGIPVELPTLEAKRDWLEVARIALLAREMQDEEDVEMLLFA